MEFNSVFKVLMTFRRMRVLNVIQLEFSVVIVFCCHHLTPAQRRCSIIADGGVTPTVETRSTQKKISLCHNMHCKFCKEYSGIEQTYKQWQMQVSETNLPRMLISPQPEQEGNNLGNMSGTRAISITSRRELS